MWFKHKYDPPSLQFFLKGQTVQVKLEYPNADFDVEKFAKVINIVIGDGFSPGFFLSAIDNYINKKSGNKEKGELLKSKIIEFYEMKHKHENNDDECEENHVYCNHHPLISPDEVTLHHFSKQGIHPPYHE